MALLRRRLVPVDPSQTQGLLALCAADPVAGLSLAHQLGRWTRWGPGDVVVLGRPTAPVAGAWTTGTLMPVGLAPRAGHEGASRRDVRELAEHAAPRLTRRGSIMGPAADVAAIWPGLAAAGLVAREERWNQPLLVAPPALGCGDARTAPGTRPGAAGPLWGEAPSTWVGRELRAARPGEEELVLPASVAMFREELGYDPTTNGGTYARHMADLVAAGRTYVVIDDGAGGPSLPGGPAAVAFKADVGALWGSHAQVTGVWTRPDLRGRGVARAALAATVARVRAEHAGPDGTVSLYVNDFNTPALALYRSLGFTQVGTFATVLL